MSAPGQRPPAAPLSRRAFLRGTAVTAAAARFAGTGVLGAVPAGAASDPDPGRVGAGFGVAWLRALWTAVRDQALPPPVAARCYAYAGVAFFEGVAAGDKRLRSFGKRLPGLGKLAKPRGNGYDWPAVAAAAIGSAVEALAPWSDATRQAFRALAEQQAQARLAAGVTWNVLERSGRLGRDLGGAVIAWAGADGYAATRGLAYTPPTGPDRWVPTPPAYGPPLEPYWGTLRPAFLTSATECEPVPPVPYSTDPASPFVAEVRAVYQAKAALTPEQGDIARFWADGAGATGTPAGHWVLLQCQMVEQAGLSTDRAAELFARTNLAMGEAFVSCWATKYRLCLLRPVTAIQRLLPEPDAATWQPLLPTPPFPEYTSGHSVASAAAARVLTALLGAFPYTDTTTALPARSFASFEAAGVEAADSRLYGGIHFPMGITRGNEQGRRLGDLANARLTTR